MDFNVRDNPHWSRQWLRNLTDDVQTYPLNYKWNDELRMLATWDVDKKSCLDYIFILHTCMAASNARYIMIIEDDVIGAQHWYPKLLK